MQLGDVDDISFVNLVSDYAYLLYWYSLYLERELQLKNKSRYIGLVPPGKK